MVDILSIPRGSTSTHSVPYALDTQGRVWAALSAPQEGSYRCLACEGHLNPQRKAGQEAAFRHVDPSPCDGSEVALLAARQLLREQLLDELQERGAIAWHRRCPGIDGVCCEPTVFERWQPLPGWKRVEIDVAGPDDRFDVAVTDTEGVRIGFWLMGNPAGNPAPPPHRVNRNDHNEPPNTVTLSLDAVLAFGPREPLDERGGERCPGCEQQAAPGGRGAIGWDETWRAVMAAAGRPENA